MKKLYTKFLQILSNSTIRKKLTFFFSLMIFFITFFIFFYFPSKLENQYLNSVKDKATTIANMTASYLSPALLYYVDTLNIMESVNEIIKNNRDIEYLIVKDNQGNSIYSFDFETAKSKNYMLLSGNIDISDDDLSIKLRKRISLNEKHLGDVYLGFTLKNVKNEIESSRMSIAYISFFLLVVGVLIVYLVSSFLTDHINKVVATFELIAAGDLSQRVEVINKDEIGDLSKSFNSMVDKFQNAYNELQNEIKVRKQTEEDLQIAKKELSKALEEEKNLSELKSGFITMVSHEYRTPLTVILTSTYLLEMLYKNRNEEEFKTQISKIHSAVQEMTQMLSDVLEVGKFTSGKTNLQYERIDIIDLLKELVSIYKTNDKKNHNFILNSHTKNCIIYTDRTMFNHIVMNLMSNAIKFSPENSNIEINMADKVDEIEITFKDYGIGIQDKDINILFEPFFRGKNTKNISGTGLGLSIVKNSVDSLNGKITVKSQLEKGSEFIVVLPKEFHNE